MKARSKVTVIVLSIGMCMWTAGVARAQTGYGGLGDAVKKDVGNAAKKQVDDTLGVPAAAPADPGAAAKGEAAGGAGDVKAPAADAAAVAPAGAKNADAPAKDADDDGDE